eukprot:TRINITY_DN7331_c0_g1_i9.p3 TRINITY_DN7331_c0_g1~~TRINITY_DN7331_c0_g1_i9.p3  ORF type:complete len:226 (+),score=-24.84 TRINITY_DN7331_c0_g1_i9:772-1449(+)
MQLKNQSNYLLQFMLLLKCNCCINNYVIVSIRYTILYINKTVFTSSYYKALKFQNNIYIEKNIKIDNQTDKKYTYFNQKSCEMTLQHYRQVINKQISNSNRIVGISKTNANHPKHNGPQHIYFIYIFKSNKKICKRIKIKAKKKNKEFPRTYLQKILSGINFNLHSMSKSCYYIYTTTWCDLIKLLLYQITPTVDLIQLLVYQTRPQSTSKQLAKFYQQHYHKQQ